MITENDIMPLNYFKKEPFSGSDRGMRYRIEKSEVETKIPKLNEDGTEAEPEIKVDKYLKVTVWPQPFSYECTEEELMESISFPFNEEGRAQVLPWLNESYERRKEIYEIAAADNGLRSAL